MHAAPQKASYKGNTVFEICAEMPSPQGIQHAITLGTALLKGIAFLHLEQLLP